MYYGCWLLLIQWLEIARDYYIFTNLSERKDVKSGPKLESHEKNDTLKHVVFSSRTQSNQQETRFPNETLT